MISADMYNYADIISTFSTQKFPINFTQQHYASLGVTAGQTLAMNLTSVCHTILINLMA